MSLLERTIKQYGPIHKDEMTWAELKAYIESTSVEGSDVVRACVLSIWTKETPSTTKVLIAFDGK